MFTLIGAFNISGISALTCDLTKGELISQEVTYDLLKISPIIPSIYIRLDTTHFLDVDDSLTFMVCLEHF
jgi:hypothetical protein